MSPNRSAIGQVVEDVDNAGKRAKHGERRDGSRHGRGVEQVSAEEHTGEDEQILGPLLRAK
jgi:hypothetical protein